MKVAAQLGGRKLSTSLPFSIPLSKQVEVHTFHCCERTNTSYQITIACWVAETERRIQKMLRVRYVVGDGIELQERQEDHSKVQSNVRILEFHEVMATMGI